MTNTSWWKPTVLLAVLIALGTLAWLTQPFSHTLITKAFNIEMLSPSQRVNLDTAAQKLNNVVLKPGDTFSFNRLVGPRRREAGYLDAPSYLNGDTPSTVGGGICLLSSALYQLALSSGFSITERVPHLRTIRSVPPGLDATVWYGKADLRFQNTLPFPVQLHVKMDPQNLTVSFLGAHPIVVSALIRNVIQKNAQNVEVEVLRESAGRDQPVSMDLYRISGSGKRRTKMSDPRKTTAITTNTIILTIKVVSRPISSRSFPTNAVNTS
jgi:vancomycin resistance protein VanW